MSLSCPVSDFIFWLHFLCLTVCTSVTHSFHNLPYHSFHNLLSRKEMLPHASPSSKRPSCDTRETSDEAYLAMTRGPQKQRCNRSPVVVSRPGMHAVCATLPTTLPQVTTQSPTLVRSQVLSTPVILSSTTCIPSVPVLPPRVIRDAERLWVDLYAPTHSSNLIGNRDHVDTIRNWLLTFESTVRDTLAADIEIQADAIAKKKSKTTKAPAKKASASKSTDFKRGLLLAGRPGIGKSTTIRLLAEELGFQVREWNASDTRSLSQLEQCIGSAHQSHSIASLLHTQSAVKDNKNNKKNKYKTLIVMEEVDGIDGRTEYGGVSFIVKQLQSSRVPWIFTCNDLHTRSLAGLRSHTQHIIFRTPSQRDMQIFASSVRERERCRRDDDPIAQELTLRRVDIPTLVERANGDVRSLLHSMQFASLHTSTLNSKHIGRDVVASSPFDLLDRLWKERTTPVFDVDAMSAWFSQEPELLPLFLQENYLGCANKTDLTAVVDAATSMSDGDILQHFMMSQQEFDLQSEVAVLSTVAPTRYLAASSDFRRTNFPSYLGKLSSTNKWKRWVTTRQAQAPLPEGWRGFTSLELAGDVIPFWRRHLCAILAEHGKAGIPQAVDICRQHHWTGDMTPDLMAWHNSFALSKEDHPEEITLAPALKRSWTLALNKANNGRGSCRGVTALSTLSATTTEEVNDIIGTSDNSDNDNDDIELELGRDTSDMML